MANMVDQQDKYEFLSAACVRKKPKNAYKLPSFKNGIKEHFVEGQVIVRCHYKGYKKVEFHNGVKKLMYLRDHSNLSGNVIYCSEEVNQEKNRITRYYVKKMIQNPNSAIIPIQNCEASFKRYVKEGGPVAREHYKEIEMNKITLDAVENYISWLEKVCHDS
jgi:hypothetical protein